MFSISSVALRNTKQPDSSEHGALGRQKTGHAINPYALSAAFLISIAAAVRTSLIAFGWPVLNSDEATMGLMTSHIAYRAAHPTFLYGQSYMGALEAYLAAPLFRLLGVSSFALRLGAVILYSLFLTSTYLLARKLYDFKVALISLALLAVGSEQMLYQQIQVVGRLETLLFGSVSLLLAFWVAHSQHPSLREGAPPKRQLAGYAGWGVVAGLGVWSDVEVIPFLLTSGLLLLVFARPRLFGRSLLYLFAGLIIGASPLIAYDLTSPSVRASIPVLTQVYRSGGTGRLNIRSSPAEGLAGAFLVTLPTMTGANSICSVDAGNAWPLTSKTGSHTATCTVLHGFWGGGIIFLWLFSAHLSLRRLIVLKRRNQPRLPSSVPTSDSRPTSEWKLATGDWRLEPAAQLALLAAAGLIFLLYAASPAASQVPWYSRRYLTPLWIALPAIVYPLVHSTKSTLGRFFVLRRAGAYISLALTSLTLIFGTQQTFAKMTAFQSWNRGAQHGLVNDLMRIQATRIYSDYWSCNRIIFQSREHVICSVLDKNLKPGQNRYPLYAQIVESVWDPFYAFPAAAPQNAALIRRLSTIHTKYRRFWFDGYSVYHPQLRP